MEHVTCITYIETNPPVFGTDEVLSGQVDSSVDGWPNGKSKLGTKKVLRNLIVNYSLKNRRHMCL